VAVAGGRESAGKRNRCLLCGAAGEVVLPPGGPVGVAAGAGTGTTKTLAARVAWPVQQGASPERVPLRTVTSRAACAG
jgi:ATP-dependent exoDNAse (exonuclease V) beta subunit